mgnify:FL=1
MVYLHRSLWVDSIPTRTQGRNTTRIISERRIEVTYKPLPDNLELRPSEIHGYGVFALEDIPAGKMLGLSHIQSPELIRTPLGGYINHSMNPNCIRILEGNRWYLQSIADISDGEELTLMYKGYKP